MWRLQQRLVELRAVLENRIPTPNLLRAAVRVVLENKFSRFLKSGRRF